MSSENGDQWARAQWSAPFSAPPFGWAGADARGFGALHYLAWSEPSDPDSDQWIIKTQLAIALGACVFAAEHEMGNTPLHWSVWQGSPRCAQALLEAGARFTELNRNGESPIQLARRLRLSAVSDSREALALDQLISMMETRAERSELLSLISPKLASLDVSQGRL